MTSSDEPALTEPDVIDDGEQEPVDEEVVPEPVAVIPDVDWVDLSGAESLDLDGADEVAADVGATVILVAGKNFTGKTSLLVQIYAQFLNGRFAGFEFAGSETLDAFDERHFGLRVASGNDSEAVEHTEDVDMRFLHLRIADATGHQRALMPTDLVGELFTDIRNGVNVGSRVPIARRADKTLLIVDGAEICDNTKRQVAERDARLILGGLTEPGGLRPEAPVMIVLTKADLLNDDDLAWFEAAAGRLTEFATDKRGLLTVTAHVTAALPGTGKPRGLAEVVTWMWDRAPVGPQAPPPPPPRTNRVFLAAGALAR